MSSLELGWYRLASNRERRAGLYAALVGIIGLILWIPVDLYLSPELIAWFLSLRAVGCGTLVGLAAAQLWLRVEDPERELMIRRMINFVGLMVVFVCIGWMLPPQTTYWAIYVLGFSLVVFGAGMFLAWPLRYAIASTVGVLMSIGAAYGLQPTSQSMEELVGAWSYLVLAGLLMGALGEMRHRDMHTTYMLEAQLREARARDQSRFRLAIHGLSVGAWEWDPETKLVKITDELGEMMGISERTLSEERIEALQQSHIRADDLSRLLRLLRQCVSTRQEETIELELTLPTGPRWFRILVTAEFEEDTLRAIVGAAQDISQQRLRDARKTMFVATMSHELRTPLNGILGMADLMDDSGLPARYRERLRTIQYSGSYMLNTINDVLDFAKIEANALTISRSKVELRRLLMTTVSMFRAQALERSIDISCWVEPDVPDTLETDSARLGQVLVNLIGNAVKFTENGTVRVWVSRGEDELVIGVVDSGIGIPADKLRSIFTPFERVDSARNRTTEGQGLGLAIAQRIVGLLGGRLTCSSTLGVGTEFSVHLAQALPPRPSFPSLRGRHVVAGGFGPATTAVVSRTLLAEECAVSVLETLDREVELPAAPDVVVVPAVALVEKCWVTRRWSTAKILVVSDGTTMFEAAEASAVLEYPVDQEALIRRVRRMIEGDGMQSVIPVDDTVLADACPLRIGIAEDDPVNRKVIAALLRREGYTVSVAEDGQQAVELVSSEELDLVFMDLHMPKVDGLEATRRIRASEGSQPYIVAFSADVALETRTECAAAGMDDVLRKPARRQELREMLRSSYKAIQATRRTS